MERKLYAHENAQEMPTTYTECTPRVQIDAESIAKGPYLSLELESL